MTRACAFACVHCRADAQHTRDHRELNTDEAKKLIDRLADFGSPLPVFTSGDPMMRRDPFELIAFPTQKINPRPKCYIALSIVRAAPSTPTAIAAGDIDEDGTVDLVYATGTGKVLLWLQRP